MAIDGSERANYSSMYVSISANSRRSKEEDRAKFTDYFAQSVIFGDCQRLFHPLL
jgi:hypothetical protein